LSLNKISYIKYPKTIIFLKLGSLSKYTSIKVVASFVIPLLYPIQLPYGHSDRGGAGCACRHRWRSNQQHFTRAHRAILAAASSEPDANIKMEMQYIKTTKTT